MLTLHTAPSAPQAYQQILYVSRLVSGCRYNVFAAICRVARARNDSAALRGLLLFDGHRFGQLIEGPVPAVQDLMARISCDPRHTDLQMLADRVLPGVSTLEDWRPGFCAPDDLDVFEGPQALRGTAAVRTFCSLSEHADLSP